MSFDSGLGVRVLFLGEADSGKTKMGYYIAQSLIPRQDLSLSMGAGFIRIDLDRLGFPMTAQCWVAGGLHFRANTIMYLLGASGAFLVYKPHKQGSLYLAEWLKEIREVDDGKIVIAVIANTKENDGPDASAEGKAFARDNSFLFFEICMKTKKNIPLAFRETMREIYSRQVN
jgi:hypothetical protein